VIVLRAQLVALDQRVTVLELTSPAGAVASDFSEVGVHYDVDKAMMADPLSLPMEMPVQIR
jgi:hypothetical protein